MKAAPRSARLSRYLLALVLGTATLALILMLLLTLAWRLPAIGETSREQVRHEATVMASRAELLLDAAEQRLQQLAALLEASPAEIALPLVARTLAEDDLLDLVALAAPGGSVQAVGLKARHTGAREDAQNLDLSGSPLLHAVSAAQPMAWYGRHLSMFTGELAVGLSLRLADGRVLVTEIELDHLVERIRSLYGTGAARGLGDSQIWLVDQRGEVLADTDGDAAVGRVNLQDTPMLQASGTAAAAGGAAPTWLWRHEGIEHVTSAVRSAQLDWVFVARQPAGLHHPRARVQLQLAGVALVLTALFSLALTPLLGRRMAAAVQALVQAASAERQGAHLSHWPQGPITELNQLSGQLGTMAAQIHAQKADLLQLNAGLEQRVAERTQALAEANAALQQSMDDLKDARDDLLRTERLASLGGLVAGVAHELNTPLGNSLLAISTLQDEMRQFRSSLAQGLRRSALDGLLEGVDTATDIAGRNIGRAADLVTSFKQVAVDQTSGQRRRFDLLAVVQELLRTLQPTLARTPYKLHVEVPAGLVMDSYPGSLGQIITNLVNNAVMHGFDGRAHGEITLRAWRDERGEVVLTVDDDGRGIPVALQGRIFDPFVTTRMGRGGTGLGLNIAHSIAANLLGGSLSFSSEEGVGTRFRLLMPAVAPQAATARLGAD